MEEAKVFGKENTQNRGAEPTPLERKQTLGYFS
jgi:hypothetical protein